MTLTIRTPKQLADDYLANLKALRPEVNIDQEDSDWWIRSRVTGGVAAGISADLNKVSNDCFPQSARREALEQHLITYFGSGFYPATYAEGDVVISGASGTVVPGGQRFRHLSTGNEYQPTAEYTMPAAGSGTVTVRSVITGQAQNLLAGTTLEIQSPPTNVSSVATVTDAAITEGRDEETDSQAATRILQRLRNPVRGGTEADYITWTLAADTTVVAAKVLRHYYGLGTNVIVVSAGTTDIDAAIDNSQTINLVPDAGLLSEIQNYIDGYNPNTDAVYCIPPTPVNIDVTASVRFETGDGSTTPAGANATQLELLQREIRRAIYKTPVGGRIIGDYGYVMLSELESMIDLNLGNGTVTTGIKYQIVKDRQVSDLSATGANRRILSTEIAVPGTLNITVL
jgi:uncharacterized phage protein gp47/JayE